MRSPIREAIPGANWRSAQPPPAAPAVTPAATMMPVVPKFAPMVWVAAMPVAVSRATPSRVRHLGGGPGMGPPPLGVGGLGVLIGVFLRAG